MTLETKQKIKAAMLEHLQSLGWPNVVDPNKLAFDQAEPMFHKLCKLGLVKYADWESYYMAAITEYERAELRKRGFPV